MKILINGETKELSSELNLSDLLKYFSLPLERVAIELNKKVVRKKDWEIVKIVEGDKLEVIHFVGGG
jgi:thiamine biosynthesis protein ThiS